MMPMKPAVRHARPVPRTRRPPVVAALVAAAVVLTAVVSLSTCANASFDRGTGEEYACPFDWNGLVRDGDRLAYREDGELKSQLGVDVSSHQGDIDWQAVAADGVGFAFVRLGNRGYTEGALYPDDSAAANLDGAAAAGLETGAYFFSQAVTADEAHEEAELALEVLDGRALDLPVAFDHEPVPDADGRANALSGEELAACARAFCERIEQAGYRAMVYGNKQDIARFSGHALGDRPVWFAEYNVAVPSARFDFAVWQYTNGGSVSGIGTAVDLNLRFTDAL